jgi:hypothetical protein
VSPLFTNSPSLASTPTPSSDIYTDRISINKSNQKSIKELTIDINLIRAHDNDTVQVYALKAYDYQFNSTVRYLKSTYLDL